MREIENQAELQRKLFKVKEEAERVRLEAELELEKQRPTSEEAQEMRHWKPKQFDLAEVQAVQNDEGGHDSLEGRLKDFEGEEELELENVPTLLVNGDKTEYTVTPKQDSEVQPLKVKFGNQETLSQANDGVQADSTVNRVILRSCLDLLPKLKLGIFDGNSIHWSDWISMFQSIIDDVLFHFSIFILVCEIYPTALPVHLAYV